MTLLRDDRESKVDNAMRSMAEAAARLVLQAYRESHADWKDDQTPVDALVTWLGLQVETFHPADYAVGTYGFMDPDEDENLIWLCRDMPLSLHRFTLAHELGHAILHCQTADRTPLAAQLKEQRILASEQEIAARAEYTQQMPDLSRTDPCNKTDVQEDMTHWQDDEQFQEALGVGQTYDPRSQRELAANLFAAELLIPQERLRRLYLEEQVIPATLAVRFEVSAAALLNRLAGLLKDTTNESGTETEKTNEPLARNVGSVEKKKYDEFQQAAIEAPTPALIVAGPGSGKTSTLIGRCEYLIHNQGIVPQQVLALTFSRKAAQEMEERLQQVLQDSETHAIPRVSTFHAFCADLLRQYSSQAGLRRDFTLIDEAEGYFLLRQQDQAIRLKHYQMLQNPTFHFPDFLKAISRAKDELVSPTEYAELAQRLKEQATDEEALERAEKVQEVAQVYALYQQALQQRGDTDFGGLLTLTLQLFQQYPEIRYEQQQKFQHILVDEFQDVNRASGVLLRELAGEKQQVWIVGDANQAIYGFRGASAENISQFTEDFSGAVILPLSRNYRSLPDLVALAETFRGEQLETTEAAGKNQPVRISAPDSYVTYAEATDEASEYNGIIQDIQRKTRQGYSYKDIMILSRTRSMAQKITHALSEAGLPSIEQGGVLEQEHVKDVISIILILTDPSGMGLLRAAHQHEHPLTQQDIEALLQAAQEQRKHPQTLILAGEAPLTMSVEGRRALIRLAQIAQTLQHTPDTWSLLAQYLLIETTLVRDQIVQREAGKKSRILSDYDRLLQMARHHDQQQARQQQQEDKAEAESAEEEVPARAEPPTLKERAHSFLEYLTLLVLLRQDNSSQQADEDKNDRATETIRVMTVHASKGLEFPIVYMPGLVQRKFPLQARASAMPGLTGLLNPGKIESELHIQGEAYLFYVGITRARDQLILSYSRNYGKSAYKRSPYLDTLEVSLPEERMQYLKWEKPKVQGEIEQRARESQVEEWSAQPGTDFIRAMRPQILRSSEIEAYLRCPREYAYNNIYHFSSDNSAYRLFWQATQKTVEELRKQLHTTEQTESASRNELDQQGAQEIYSQHWEAVGGPAAYFATMYEEHGQKVIETLRRKLSTQREIRWEVHASLPIEIAGKTVHVSVDRIEESEQTDIAVKFVRTRFGKQKEKPVAEARDLFYTLAYRQNHPQQKVEVHNHNMSTDEVSPISIGARKEQGLYNEIEQAIKGLEQNAYPIKPDPFRCPNCAYFLICPV